MAVKVKLVPSGGVQFQEDYKRRETCRFYCGIPSQQTAEPFHLVAVHANSVDALERPSLRWSSAEV